MSLPDSAKNFLVSLCKKALPGFLWMSTLGTFISSGISDELSFMALSGTSEPRELTISFARDAKEFSNTVPSLIMKTKEIVSYFGFLRRLVHWPPFRGLTWACLN